MHGGDTRNTMTEFSGTLDGVGLPAIVRFLCGLQKTGCLHIGQGDWRADVEFDAGRLSGASFASRHGMAALDAIVQVLPSASFAFDVSARPTSAHSIELSVEALQAHLEDLLARLAAGAPGLPGLDVAPQLVIHADSDAAEEPLPLERGALRTLVAVDGEHTVREIVAERGSFEPLWQLGDLAQAGLVRWPAPGLEAGPRGEAASVEAGPRVVASSALPSVERATPGVAPSPPAASASHVVAPPVRPTAPAVVDPDRLGVDPVAPAPATPVDQPSAEQEELPGHCPKLGFEDDPSNSFGRPTRLHRCFAAGTPLPLSLDQQRELCLSDQFGICPRLTMSARGAHTGPTLRDFRNPRPAGGRAPAAPGGASVGAGEEPGRADESEADDSRIVRLPLAGRGNAPYRRGPRDWQTDAAANTEPRQLLSASSPPPGDPPRPTPLRARLNRAGSATNTSSTAGSSSAAGSRTGAGSRGAAPLLSAAGSLSAAGARERAASRGPAGSRASTGLTGVDGSSVIAADSLDSSAAQRARGFDASAAPEARSSHAATRPSAGPTRFATLFGGEGLGGPPVALIALAAVVLIALVVLAYVFAPRLGSLFVDDSADLSGLPNASAVAAGTPVAQITARRTPVSTAPSEGASAASPPDAASPANAANATPPATVPAPAKPQAITNAQPAVAAPVFEDNFADNAHNWPSNPQGTAWLAGGGYHLATRQPGQFVAIGAPIADVPHDVVVSATFRKLSDAVAGGGFGIILRDQGTAALDGASQSGRYYVLEVGDKGEVGIWRRDTDHWVDILPWQHSDAVNAGVATNELTVSAIGNRLSLSVNGTLIATRTDATFATGGVGLMAGGDGNHLVVDHLTVQAP